MKLNLLNQAKFEPRHNASADQTADMLKTIGVDSLEELIAQTIPDKIRLRKPMDLPVAQTEAEFLQSFKKLSRKNQVFKSYIGMGYYNTFTPTVILRNIMENPGWYTAYTPYQAEIAQGRLEMLLNFQTMVCDLTGMEIANASLLDEGTAAAEALHLMHAQRPANKQHAHVFFVSELCHPQTIDLLKTRSAPIGVELLIGNHKTTDFTN
ncbi:MAG: glycine dehydrogenase (aminomethyl-transferring), partial [Verrucomicrobia bacterium]|nr:glycine dehydrogenase (aminomethyl-transferring) [Cytophagales bacterium]